MYEVSMIKIALKAHVNRKNNGMNIKDILMILGISRSTLYEWIKKYSNQSSDYFDKRRKMEKYTYHKKLSDECIREIIEYVKSKVSINIKTIRKMIKTKYKVSVNKNYIYFLLKKHNLTYKKAQKNKYPYGNAKLEEKKEVLKDELTKVNNDYISIDETSMVINTKTKYGWSEKGKKCNINEPNNSRRYSMCMAIDKQKIISYRLTKGTFNSQKYTNYVVNDVIKKSDKKGILMDNATIHKRIAGNEILKNRNIRPIDVAYCPEYNPIEYVFNVVKSKLKSYYVTKYDDLRYRLRKIVDEINTNGLENYYRKSYSNLFRQECI